MFLSHGDGASVDVDRCVTSPRGSNTSLSPPRKTRIRSPTGTVDGVRSRGMADHGEGHPGPFTGPTQNSNKVYYEGHTLKVYRCVHEGLVSPKRPYEVSRFGNHTERPTQKNESHKGPTTDGLRHPSHPRSVSPSDVGHHTDL